MAKNRNTLYQTQSRKVKIEGCNQPFAPSLSYSMWECKYLNGVYFR
uniref:Uncharacterized protein n=1 Tax=Candidatus Kentrum eta TaxID=2126337 RepID=A0A450VBC4_9GAMM|nr:MAG: hypothetical protein BECKH772B_GA0070898_102544 [Candidatus Kentron sp. H]VFK02092.1 MAG: hypothetical protein BECKH772A_GA0070896_102533 [Candidatus Kentron sp. H]VFK05265.1 MAG: hypothetical protein BECKH772C_GA0070978_102533 [Candidatus Kentron sp. H]